MWRIGGVGSTTLLSEEGDQVGSEEKNVKSSRKAAGQKTIFC